MVDTISGDCGRPNPARGSQNYTDITDNKEKIKNSYKVVGNEAS